METGLIWNPDSLLNLTLDKQSSGIDVVLNGTNYYSHQLPSNQLTDGNIGLHYGTINDIVFYDYKRQIGNEDRLNDEMLQGAPNGNYLVSDSQTVLLEDIMIPEDEYIHLYDTSPYVISNGHIVAKIPCDEDGNADIFVLGGQTSHLSPISMSLIPTLSDVGELCIYEGDVRSTESNPITDIILQNNSTDAVELPESSSLTISVIEISK
jgi:hypothetical protein